MNGARAWKIRICLLGGAREQAIQLLREAAQDPGARRLLRNAFNLNPRMKPFQQDQEIIPLLAP